MLKWLWGQTLWSIWVYSIILSLSEKITKIEEPEVGGETWLGCICPPLNLQWTAMKLNFCGYFGAMELCVWLPNETNTLF